jgi:glycerol-3-phosphate acyltransferase PlsY
MGYFVVWLIKKQDITKIGSGRTGGTNALRAGGIGAFILTSILDVGKGLLAVWIARWLFPNWIWGQVLAGSACVIGHNWSLILYWLTGRFSGGAGTGPNIGAAIAFWPGIAAITIPLIVIFVFIIGYASLASLAAGLAIVISFYFRSVWAGTPWEYIVYGVLTLLFVTWSLRPNIQRLLKGTERRVGLFAKKQARVGDPGGGNS